VAALRIYANTVRPRLDGKLGPVGKRRIEFAIRRLVKTQPKMRKTLRGGSNLKNENRNQTNSI
jgi:hypothetical protein